MKPRITIEIAEQLPIDVLEYARIPIAYEVRQILDVVATASGLGGPTLLERSLDSPYVKDYDAIAGEGPLTWPGRFDLSKWQIFTARVNQQLVGGVAVVLDGSDVDDMLEGAADLALIWDIRVSPEARGLGVGSALFRRVEEASKMRGVRRLKVETQNTNVPACRFYARQGCILGAVNRYAYPDLPHETQLFWYKDLSRSEV